MLLSLFLPSYWKNKLLFSRKILSIGIRDGLFIACLANVSRSKTTLLNAVNVVLPEEHTAQPTFETQAEQIKKTILSMGKYDQLVITESSDSIIFKELEFAFSTRDQLDLVLSEELEPQLPFNPQEAYTGYVINEVRPDGTSLSLTATVKKADFDAKFTPFSVAQIFPNSVAIDTEGIAYCIHQLYPTPVGSEIPLRIIIDIKNTYTQLIFSSAGTIKAVKNIPFGKLFLYQDQMKKSTPQAEAAPTENPLPAELTTPAQLETSEEKQTPLEKNLTIFTDKILFTSDALALRYCESTTPQIFFFLNAPCDPTTLQKAIEPKTNRTLEFFSPQIAASNTSIIRAKQCPDIDWTTMCSVVGTACLFQNQNHIDLPVQAAQEKLFSIVKKNILVACIIFAGIVGTVTAVGYRQLSSLGRVLEIAESTQLTKLKEKFPQQLADQRKLTLKRAISQIEDYVKEQQIFWNMFGSKSLNPLEILYELTELIDRRLFTVDINHVTIALSEDDHTPRITVEGTFMSKTDAHYSDFGLLEKHLAMSKRLMLTKDIESSFDDNAHGVKFTARFKLRDQ